jgi:quercetin dioxygenase-like cupin family protein
MAILHLQPNEVLRLPLGATLQITKTTTLVKTSELEVIRLVVSAGKEIPMHNAPGPITVQCLEGRASFTACGTNQELGPGDFLYLPVAEPHVLKGIEDSSLLVTIQLPKKSSAQRLDLVQQAGEESFPASDSPAISSRTELPRKYTNEL